MSENHFVVIGNGPAGNQAAQTLLKESPTTRITIISKEREWFYKPYLLPDFIDGKISEKELYGPAPLSISQSKNIVLRMGQQVVDINLPLKELILDHKEKISFNGLIIAVGGKPRIPEYLYAFEKSMHTLKTIRDAKVWIDKLSKVDSVLIMGGDLTSFSITRALINLGKEVFFMLNGEALWPLRFNKKIAEDMTNRLSQKGVQVLPYKKIRRISRLSSYSYQLQLNDEKIEVGFIGAFFGLVPDIQFLAHSGLQIDRGILVDEYLNTGIKGVYATGDCAQIYHPEIRDYWVSIGHENAEALGRVAALNLLGGMVQKEVKKESIFKVQGVNVNTSWWEGF